MPPELLSIELTNRCAKACWFCYKQGSKIRFEGR
jgi:hypothetical protein